MLDGTSTKSATEDLATPQSAEAEEADVWYDTRQSNNLVPTHGLDPRCPLIWIQRTLQSSFVAATGILEKLGIEQDQGQPFSISRLIVHKIRHETVPIVLDTGYLILMTPFRDNFTEEPKPTQEETMQGLKDSVHVKGIGWVE